MASLSHTTSYTNFYVFARNINNEPNMRQLICVKKHGIWRLAKTKVMALGHNNGATSISVNGTILEEQIRQNIPTKKQFVDPYRQGIIIEEGVGYRQTVVIRSYEVGPDKSTTIESTLNLLQETALNHVWMSGLLGDGFGATHGMMRNNLIWVVSRMQLEVEHYPICTWVMMNKQTRRLSKMPDEVRGEIAPWFLEKQAIKEEMSKKIEKLDNRAKYVTSDLRPKRDDLDMNHHVNNVKYVRWMLETIPEEFVESHQLSSMVLEYRRECGSSDIVQSFCEPFEAEIMRNGSIEDKNFPSFNGFGFSIGSNIFNGNNILGCFDQGQFKYTHLLKIQGIEKNEEIVRGRTTWKRKNASMPFSA